MARKTQRAAISLSEDQRSKLGQISKSRKAPLREVQRAQVLLHYADGMPISQIQKLVKDNSNFILFIDETKLWPLVLMPG